MPSAFKPVSSSERARFEKHYEACSQPHTLIEWIDDDPRFACYLHAHRDGTADTVVSISHETLEALRNGKV